MTFRWQDAAAVKMLDIKERSATGLQYAIHSHPRLEVNILLMPSYLVVPHGGKFQGLVGISIRVRI
jgi:vacuolar protein sorting-associated protein 13A/C